MVTSVQPLPLLGSPSGVERRFRAGAIIFHQGDRIATLSVVRTGTVRLSAGSEQGCECAVDVLGPGDVFGESALLGLAPSPIEARAVADCRIATLPPDAVSPELLACLGSRLLRTTQALVDALLLDASGRLERTLVSLADRHGVAAPGGVRIDLPLTQGELAAMIGTSRETVNRIVAGLTAEGRLRVRGRRYTLADRGSPSLEATI